MVDMGQTNVTVRCTSYNNQNKSGTLFISHKFRLCLVLAGTVTWQIGNREYVVKQGDVVLLSNTVKRRLKHIEPGEDMQLLSLAFEPQLLFSTGFLPLFLDRRQQLDPVIPSHAMGQVSPFFQQLWQEWQGQQPGWNTMITAHVFNILVWIKRYYHQQGHDFDEATPNHKMHRVLDYIGANFDQEITLEQVAGMMFLSPSAFSKCFLKYNGVGFKQYVISKRMEKAIFLLETTDDTVLTIAAACGFHNGASFYKAFRKTVGVPPHYYRRFAHPKQHSAEAGE